MLPAVPGWDVPETVTPKALRIPKLSASQRIPHRATSHVHIYVVIYRQGVFQARTFPSSQRYGIYPRCVVVATFRSYKSPGMVEERSVVEETLIDCRRLLTSTILADGLPMLADDVEVLADDFEMLADSFKIVARWQ